MKLNKDTVYTKLICYGLFPEKLEKILTSVKFGLWIKKNESVVCISEKKSFSLLQYRLTRNNNAPRLLGIPNPFGYNRLCVLIRDYWDKFDTIFSNSEYIKKSSVIPKDNNTNNRLITMVEYTDSTKVEQKLVDFRFGKKCLIYADIAACYSSIYTHSIGWALVGKDVAKNGMCNEKEWYNQIDKACQNLQDRETRGVPAGPDTSRVLSEIILAKIDIAMSKYTYTRYVDDFVCMCESIKESNDFINDLSKNLEEYRLYLNHDKTSTVYLPKAINEPRVHKLNLLSELKIVGNNDKDKIVAYIDETSELYHLYPKESIIRYSAQELRKLDYENFESYWLVFKYLLNMFFLFPYIADVLDDFIEKGIKKYYGLMNEIKKTLKTTIKNILKEHIQYNRSDAVVWSLFLAIKYEIQFEDDVQISDMIIKSKDCLPTLLSYLYNKINKNEVKQYLDLLKKINDKEWWLFDYEVRRIEKLKMNEEMEILNQAGISFLSNTITSKL